jgi:hypothetical protein
LGQKKKKEEEEKKSIAKYTETGQSPLNGQPPLVFSPAEATLPLVAGYMDCVTRT